MKSYTLALNQEQVDKLKQLYAQNLMKVNQPYVSFVATHNGTRISAFTSCKVLLQGDQLNSELVTIKSYLGIKNYAAIGSDEVGTGDAFGPIVVCSCYTSESDIEFLEKLNIRDSKTLTNRKIIEIGPKIAAKLTHTINILPPERYNSLTKEGFNLNKIKALLHNHMIIKTTSKINRSIPVILDQFCLPSHYYNYLKDEKLIYRDIEFHTKAENVHISVAAASIIARYAFLVKMHELSKMVNLKLKLGASKEVDDQIKEIYDQYGIEMLNKIGKLNFKNYTKQDI